MNKKTTLVKEDINRGRFELMGIMGTVLVIIQ